MTDYATPSDYSLSDNMALARNYANSHSTPENLYWFYQQVNYDAPWDYKTQSISYEYLGNFNYGATGAAMGFSEQLLLRAAALAQVWHGTSKDEWGNPVGFAPYGEINRLSKMESIGLKTMDIRVLQLLPI